MALSNNMFTTRRWIFAVLAGIVILFLFSHIGDAPSIERITHGSKNGDATADANADVDAAVAPPSSDPYASAAYGEDLASIPNEESEVVMPPTSEEAVPGERFAFATFMNPNVNQADQKSDDDDSYFVSARMMAFQLLHNPETKTRKGYPFLVLVSEGVSESKLERLRKDGATVIPVQRITSDWLKTKNSQWWDQLTKLRLWEMTQFDKIAYFDTDTVVRRNVDDIFNDDAAAVSENLNQADKAPEDEGKQPMRYVFAGNAGAGRFDHPFPPKANRKNLNAGCFVIMPSNEVFEYYMKVLSIEGRFPLKYMEQGLLAYIHRPDGNMPWHQMHYMWNTNYVTFNDTLHDIATLHAKFWQITGDEKLTEYVYDIKGKMYGYWMGRESN